MEQRQDESATELHAKDVMLQEGLYERALYLDMEWTCWDTRPPHGMQQEIIEIGIVSMDLNKLEILDEASYFVRPKRWEISLKCTQLTGITHEDIVKADSLRMVVEAASQRFEPKSIPCCTWGDDVTILTKACAANGFANPFGRSLDLSGVFQGAFALKERVALKKATRVLGIGFDGFAHGALPDARNTALIHRAMLGRLRSSPKPAVLSNANTSAESVLSPFANKLMRSLERE